MGAQGAVRGSCPMGLKSLVPDLQALSPSAKENITCIGGILVFG